MNNANNEEWAQYLKSRAQISAVVGRILELASVPEETVRCERNDDALPRESVCVWMGVVRVSSFNLDSVHELMRHAKTNHWKGNLRRRRRERSACHRPAIIIDYSSQTSFIFFILTLSNGAQPLVLWRFPRYWLSFRLLKYVRRFWW